jgi:cell division protein FtsI (penicillin-binding protein 3)
MTRALRKKARNKKRLYAVILFVVLLAAAGVELYRLPPSLLDIGRLFRLAADKLSAQSADISSAEAVLRGTIFDRNLNELAVSYQLYSLFIRPSEISDPQKVTSVLSRLTGLEEGELELRMRSGGSLVKIAENLEQQQASDINGLRLAGIYSKPTEERFYPEHEAAADLIGYTGEGTGLAGIEGNCDTILQHGDFRSSSVPEIDFKNSRVLGSSKLDIVLTLDLEIQKAIEHKLRDYLKTNGATRGLALVMNARTGAILAWVSRPSFNPNYFWQAPDTIESSLFHEMIDSELYRNILIRAAAVRKNGELGGRLLPMTIAADNYGLQENEIRQYGEIFGLGEDFFCRLPVCTESIAQTDKDRSGIKEKGGISAQQFIIAAAGLLNGGWKVKPYVLDSIYDESQMRRYGRSKEYDSAERRRIMSPSMGIMVRMNLPHEQKAAAKDLFLHTSSVVRIVQEGVLSRYVMQDMVIGAMPVKSPEIIILMVTRQDNLNPLPAGLKHGSGDLADLGEKILPVAYKLAVHEVQRDFPKGRDTSNYNQFLISRRIDFQEQNPAAGQNGPVMPLVTGLSLRKGLQRLNAYNLKVRVEGSGRIVNQQPESGKPLNGIGECTLILESNI